MQRPTHSACSPLHHFQPPSTVLPHARAPPSAQRPAARGQLHRPRAAAPLRGEVQQMKRRIAVVALVFVTFALIAQQALAVSPHFVSASARLSGTNLIVSFKEAGLGTNQNITYTASADATATYVCVNRGGANPSASNKTTVSGPVSATGTFNSGKNGNVTASLTLNPPGPGKLLLSVRAEPGDRAGDLHQRGDHRYDKWHHRVDPGHLLYGMPAAQRARSVLARTASDGPGPLHDGR
jgi:hypothetical protein